MNELAVEHLEAYGVKRLLEELGAEKIVGSKSDVRSTCPVHGGSNGSALHYHNGFFTCFSDCNRTYSAQALVQKALKLTYAESLEYLERRIGINYDKEVDTDLTEFDILDREFMRSVRKIKDNTQEEQPVVDISDLEKFPKILHTSLAEEGFTAVTREKFDLRFCTYGFFKERIIIPIHAPNTGDDDRVIGIAARSTKSKKTIDMLGIGKYLFSKGLKKSQTLYNYNRVISYEKVPYVIVVEGYKSVWRLAEWGYNNAVAIMGAEISEQQKMLLLKLNCPIIASGDNDEAGRRMQDKIKRELSHFTKVQTFPIREITSTESDSIAELFKSDFERKLNEIL